jgi:tetratricopeptide (TPR) repeat protein
MNNLAYSYADYAEHREESLTLRQQLLALRRKVNGPEHPNTLLAMEDLGDYYAQAGRLDDAVKLWEDALVISRKVNGPEHPDTLFLMNTLADGYFGAGQPDKALNLREQALAPSRKVLGPEHPFTRAVMNHLVESYFAAGRIRDAVTLLEESVRSNPKDTEASLTLAIWQTSCGQDADYEVTRRRLLQQAEGTDQPVTAERAAKVACLRPSTNAALLTNALNLAQRAVELGKKDQYLPFYQLALGLAEYRNAQYAAAEQTLTVAGETVGDHHDLGIDNRSEIQGTARLFRAMSLFKQDKLDEARKLFSQAEAEMPPLPKDESKPIVEGKPFDRDLIVRWLAYKEAKALIEGP